MHDLHDGLVDRVEQDRGRVERDRDVERDRARAGWNGTGRWNRTGARGGWNRTGAWWRTLCLWTPGGGSPKRSRTCGRKDEI